MKKLVFSILAITALLSTTVAQNESQGKFQIGAKAGLNLSNIYNSQKEELDAKGKVGYVFGGFMNIPLGTLFGLQPEVLVSQKGFIGEGTLLGSNYDLTRTSTFLDIPLMLAIKPTSDITLLLGPQFSYLLKQKDVFSNSSLSIQQEQDFKNENIRKNTMCFIGGADIDLIPIVFGLRAGWDLKENLGDGTSTTPRYKNVWLQATIGIKL
jgi:hypothetical protein